MVQVLAAGGHVEVELVVVGRLRWVRAVLVGRWVVAVRRSWSVVASAVAVLSVVVCRFAVGTECW